MGRSASNVFRAGLTNSQTHKLTCTMAESQPKLHENFRIQVIVSRKSKDDGEVDFSIAAGKRRVLGRSWDGRTVDSVQFATGMVKIPFVKGGSLLFVKETTGLADVTRVGEAFKRPLGLWPRNDDMFPQEEDRFGPGKLASATLVTSEEIEWGDDDPTYQVTTHEPVGHQGPQWKDPLNKGRGWRWGDYEELYKAPRKVKCDPKSEVTLNPTLEFLVYAGGPKVVRDMTDPGKETWKGMTRIGTLVIDLGQPVYGPNEELADFETELEATFIKTGSLLHAPQAEPGAHDGGFEDYTRMVTTCHS